MYRVLLRMFTLPLPLLVLVHRGKGVVEQLRQLCRMDRGASSGRGGSSITADEEGPFAVDGNAVLQ